MNYNNRQPVYKPKVYKKRKVYHTEVKNGVTIFVEGKGPNPYEGVSCDSLKLKSRIETGTFVDHEGSPIKLEKANGSDVAISQIEESQREFDKQQEENYRKRAKKRLDEAYEKHKKDALENPVNE